jgi:hypothetical protein
LIALFFLRDLRQSFLPEETVFVIFLAVDRGEIFVTTGINLVKDAILVKDSICTIYLLVSALLLLLLFVINGLESLDPRRPI